MYFFLVSSDLTYIAGSISSIEKHSMGSYVTSPSLAGPLRAHGQPRGAGGDRCTTSAASVFPSARQARKSGVAASKVF